MNITVEKYNKSRDYITSLEAQKIFKDYVHHKNVVKIFEDELNGHSFNLKGEILRFITLNELKKKCRKKIKVELRQALCHWLYFNTNYALREIAEITGQNHATIIHSLKDFEFRFHTSRTEDNNENSLTCWKVFDKFLADSNKGLLPWEWKSCRTETKTLKQIYQDRKNYAPLISRAIAKGLLSYVNTDEE
jgi:hypothetical protein